MKKYRSLLMLYARQSALWLLVILLLLGCAQAALFSRAAKTAAPTAYAYTVLEDGTEEWLYGADPGLEMILQRSGVRWALLAAFVLLTAVLCQTGCAFGSRCGYTLERLPVSMQAQGMLQALYNGACYLALWGFETGLLWLLCARWCAGQAGSNALTIPLAFWRDGLLHGLLPLAEWPLWVRNFLLLAALSLAAAAFPRRQREGKLAVGTLFLAALTCGGFVTEVGMDALDAALIFLSVIDILYYGYFLLRKEAADDGTDPIPPSPEAGGPEAAV